MSPGITRGFPRLCPALGLVAVALLTLAPRPLRGVRLACLIHAANVHSEPGSNPSRWWAGSEEPPRLPQGLRNLAGRADVRGSLPAVRSTWSPAPSGPPREGGVRPGSRATPASLKGSHDDRPDCQRSGYRQRLKLLARWAR